MTTARARPEPLSLVDLLQRSAAEKASRRPFTFLGDSEGEEETLSYGALDRSARRIGAALQARAGAGARALLLYPPGLEYVAGFFGCLYAGVVAVPAYPPDPSRLERTLPRLRAIIQDAEATVVLTTSAILSMADYLFEQAPDFKALHWMATDGLEEGLEDAWRRPPLTGDALAFLQYTSGSTGTPKGVMLTHGNLLHNLKLIAHAFQVRPESVGTIWLPPYHDMGLIGGILEPLYAGIETVLLSPLAFLRRPLRWLEAISRFRGSISGGPNFAFDLCVRKTSPEERQRLDLRSWEVAFCGAEPIRAETLDRFVEAFGPCGFRREAFYPCYGLAEATLIAAGGDVAAPPIIHTLDAAALAGHRAVPVPPGARGGQAHVGCGRSLPDQELLIVDPSALKVCAPGEVGEIWLSGPSVARGYFGKPEETERAFQAQPAGVTGKRYLRTGDLGLLAADGELLVTGRIKDLIIVRGRNHYPQDIELAVEQSHPEIRPGCSAAFSLDVSGEERLAVAVEVSRELASAADPARFEAVASAIRQAVSRQNELFVHTVALLAPGAIPKTSSGKIQRQATRAALLGEELAPAWLSTPEAPALEVEEAAATAGEVPAAPEERRAFVERHLREALSAVLGPEAAQLGLEAPLAGAGLDSLRATELQGRLESRLQASVPIALLLQDQSLASLVDSLARGGPPGGSAIPALQPGPREPVVRASLSQSRVWVLQQLDPGSAAYHVPVALSLRGPLDVPALERGLAELVRRHEALRTTFEATPDGLVQRIHPPAPVALPVEALPGLPAPAREAAVAERAALDGRAPFDVQRGPLLRARLLSFSAEEHVLVLSAHHLVVDGWSVGLLVRELASIYAAALAGQPSRLPEPGLQYSDFARWQRGALTGEVLAPALAWWREALDGAPPPLALPADRPRPPRLSPRGARRTVAIPPALWERLRALGRREGATPFMVLLSALSAVLHRWSGQRDFVVGTVVSGRDVRGAERLVGDCTNFVPLRVRLSGTDSGLHLLSQVKQVVRGALAHAHCPYEKLVAALSPAAERRELYSVAFVLDDFEIPRDLAMGEALSGSLSLLDNGTTELDMTFEAGEGPEGLSIGCKYSADLFDAGTVDRLLGHLRVLLEALAGDPGRSIGELPLMGPEEWNRVVVEWNATGADSPRDECIHHLFEAQVRRAPDRVAVDFEGARLTYRQLDQRANQLAWHLRSLGVGPESLVGLCLERSPELVVGLLAVLKAGGAYVPLDPGYPQAQLAWMVEDIAAPVLLTQQRLRERLPAGGARVLCLDAVPSAGLDRWPVEAPPSAVTAGHLAYVIFTSGSTGRPKGAMNAHRGVCNRLRWMQQTYRLTEEDRVLQKTPYSFDVSVWEFFWPLMAGARLVVARPGGHRDPSYLRRLISEERITTVHFVPSMLQVFLEEPELQGCSSLRRIICSGEALSTDLQDRCLARLGASLHNLYGPTEAAVDVTSWECRAGDGRRSVPIGRPVSNTRLYVLDEGLRPTPIGVPGELYIGGVQVGRGYHRRPGLTAERFIPDPFSSAPGARLYKTGDLAAFLPDGAIEYLGRLDHQVKLRGLRVELGEIEAALSEHPAVREAVVVAWEPAPGDKRLVAYFVPSAPGEAAVAQVRQWLAERLPEHMVPSALVALARMPLSPNGKLDRRALPAPSGADLAAGAPAAPSTAAPLTGTEQALAAIWQELLGVPAVAPGQTFFALGGHSLLAIQLVSRVRASLGAELPLGAVFESPSLGELARRIESARGGGDRAGAILRRDRPGGTAPLSFDQERFLAVYQMAPDSPAYNLPALVRLRGPLDRGALEEGLRALAERHELLRTSIETDSGSARQRIHPRADLPLELVAAAGEDEARRIAGERARRPFDFQRAPLARATLIQLAPEDHVLLLCLHHLVADAWSGPILFAELQELYRARATGTPPQLAPLPVQYADYAEWQRERLTPPLREAQLQFWLQRLAGVQPLALPADRPRPPQRSWKGRQRRLALGASLSESLRALAAREGVTPYVLLLAAVKVLLVRHTGDPDVAVMAPVSSRGRAELEAMVGYVANVFWLRTGLGGDPSFSEVVRRVRDTCVAAFDQRDVPFEQVLEALRAKHGAQVQPQVLFAMLDALPRGRAGALSLEPWDEPDLGGAKFDLAFTAVWGPDGLVLVLESSDDLFEGSTAERLLGRLRALLEGIAADPGARLHALPLLPGAERAAIDAWNRSAAPHPNHLAVHQLVEAQAARTPDAVAVAMALEDRSLTYAELDRRANRLAHRLIALGVGVESPVASFMDRSLEMAVGLLGALKAGAVFLPLDPSYPRERLSLMLRDAGCRVLLTRSPLAPLLPDLDEGTRALELDRFEEVVGPQPGGAPATAACGESLAYLIYTSGSTGVPKGVALPHRVLTNLASWQIDSSRMGPGTRTVQFAALSFDVSLQEIFSAWCSGGTLLLLPEEVRHDPPALLDLLARSRAERLFLPNVALQKVAEAAEAGGLALPAALRELGVGGEQLRITPQLRRMMARMPGCRLVNWYGPSETHVCTFFPLPGAPDGWPALPSIGFPISNSRLHVLDAALRPAPIGVYGELYVAGDCVARGYLGRPGPTAEKFVPDPWSPSPGGRMYRTGDWARWMPDGTLDFLGRRDHQVKIRGFRVELGEIEAVLQHHPAVREAAVVPRADPSGARRLVAYLTLRGGAPAAADPVPEVRAFLRQRLPEYLVPSAFVVMEAFPLSPAGKVDRLSLPEPSAADAAGAASEYVAPRTPLEEALAAMWSEVLQVPRVGAHDAFWDLGGHSLLATQLLARMRELFGVQIQIRTLFEAPTVAKLAEALLRTADAPRVLGVAEMLKEVSEMSDEQVARELEQLEEP